MKRLKIASFRDKVSLKIAVLTVDSELNRTETLRTAKVVWANVEVRGSNIDDTTAGHKPQLKYKITMRKENMAFDYLEYNGKLLVPTGPHYIVDNMYIVVEAEETV